MRQRVKEGDQGLEEWGEGWGRGYQNAPQCRIVSPGALGAECDHTMSLQLMWERIVVVWVKLKSGDWHSARALKERNKERNAVP